jgi:predicted methyltransferase
LTIDATAGNGYDTLFLAECVGLDGKVLAFDVQESAVASARSRVTDAGMIDRVSFFQESHENLLEYTAAGSASVIMFNLGYLPGYDHELTTEAVGTLAALESAAVALKPGGVLSVTCYPGHAQGLIEAESVEEWMTSKASNGWRIAKYGAIGTKKPAPFLLLAAAPL